MSDPLEEARRHLEHLRRLADDRERELREDVRIIRVDKRTHRVRFEGETEDEVVIVVERLARKEDGPS